MKRITISFVLAGALYISGFAQNMILEKFYYRDYLDLGQNRGAFSKPDKEVKIKMKDGKEFTFDRIPNNFVRTEHGAFTSLGRNYVVTAKHIESGFWGESYNPKKSSGDRTIFGQTKYTFLTGEHKTENTRKYYTRDTMYLKTSKYIVEGEIAPIDVPNLKPSNDINTKEISDKMYRLVSMYLRKSDKNNDDYVHLYQAGKGELRFDNLGKFSNVARGGSLYTIEVSKNMPFEKEGKYKDGVYFGDGVDVKVNTDITFRNSTTQGDSGSGFYVYDEQKQKWVVLGVDSKGDGLSYSYISLVTSVDFSDYKKQYEYKHQNTALTTIDLQKDKDNIIDKTTTITINNDYKMGHGGIVVNQGKTTIAGRGSFSEFAGFDIAKGASVDFNIKANMELHKIGKGTLNIKSENATNLRLGNGVVEIERGNAFKNFYITSGRGTLKLGENANGFDLNKVFFGNGGGKLDINGKSLETKNISANDKNANIINSNASKSTLTIKGNDDDKDTIVHASIGGNDKNKIDLKVENVAHRTIVFNSDVNIGGKFEVTSAKVMLQGHPTTHAKKTPSLDPRTLAQYDTNMPEYMKLELPSNLNQPDWDEMKFKTAGVDLKNNSTLSIGKGATLDSDITADNSNVNFGGNLDYFIDQLDGENTHNTQDGLAYKQDVASNTLSEKDQGNDTIKYEKTITAKNSSNVKSDIESFAPILALSNSKLNAKFLTINDKNKITLDATSKASVENLVFKDINSNAQNKIEKTQGAKFDVTKSLMFDNTKDFDLKGSDIDNLKDLNVVAKNNSQIKSSEDVAVKGISLDG